MHDFSEVFAVSVLLRVDMSDVVSPSTAIDISCTCSLRQFCKAIFSFFPQIIGVFRFVRSTLNYTP